MYVAHRDPELQNAEYGLKYDCYAKTANAHHIDKTAAVQQNVMRVDKPLLTDPCGTKTC